MTKQQVDIEEFEHEIIKRRSDLNLLISNKKIPEFFIRDESCAHNDIGPDLYAWAWYGLSQLRRPSHRPLGSTDYKPNALGSIIGFICHPILLDQNGKLKAPKNWLSQCVEFIERNPPDRVNFKSRIHSRTALEGALRREKKRIELWIRENQAAIEELKIDVISETDKK